MVKATVDKCDNTFDRLNNLIDILKFSTDKEVALGVRMAYTPHFLTDPDNFIKGYVAGYITSLLNEIINAFSDITENTKLGDIGELIDTIHEELVDGTNYTQWPIMMNNCIITIGLHRVHTSYIVGDVYINHESSITRAFNRLMEREKLKVSDVFPFSNEADVIGGFFLPTSNVN